jgi:haloalkane dehalogenase
MQYMRDMHRIEVLNQQMAYVDAGQGDPLVFLHGNPTSSYLWRHVMPHLTNQARCIAPDLIGMGESDKLGGRDPERYAYAVHRQFLDALLETLGVNDRVTLVLHDWGSALGFDWAARHADKIKGIAYMEAIVAPLTWKEWPEASRPLFQALRSEAGEKLVLEKNVFVEKILPASIQRSLTDEELDAYRAPFPLPGEDRRAMLSWPRSLPIDGTPAEIVAIVDEYSNWMADNTIPKLFINASPGAILVGAQREFCRSWANQTEVTVAGIHFVQEDSPVEIGDALASWYETLN